MCKRSMSLISLLFATIVYAQATTSPTVPSQAQPTLTPEPVAPTGPEVTKQTNQAATLIEKAAVAERATAAKNEIDQTVGVLQKRIQALEAQRQRYEEQKRATEAMKEQIAQLQAERERLEADQERAAAEERQAIRDLQLTTLTAVANRADGLSDGLRAAQAIGQVTQLTMLFKPGQAPGWTNWLDRAGRLLGGGAGLVAAGSSSDTGRENATRAAVGGVALYLAGNYLKERFQPQNKSLSELREYVQRVSMHKNFATYVAAFNKELLGVTTALQPVQDATQPLLGGDTCALLRFRVNSEFISKYRTAVDSYGGIITVLTDLNRLSTQMKTDGGWEAPVAADIERVAASSAEAIRYWRKGVLTSTSQIQNLERLVKSKPPDMPSTCGPPQ